MGKIAYFLELALQLEKLTNPNPKLDSEVWCAAFAPDGAYVEKSKFNGAWCIFHGVSVRSGRPNLWEAKNSRVQPITASVDAALCLVPRGWIVEACRAFDDDGEYWSKVVLVDSFSVGRGNEPEDRREVMAHGSGNLAGKIAAAALKARALAA